MLISSHGLMASGTPFFLCLQPIISSGFASLETRYKLPCLIIQLNLLAHWSFPFMIWYIPLFLSLCVYNCNILYTKLYVGRLRTKLVLIVESIRSHSSLASY